MKQRQLFTPAPIPTNYCNTCSDARHITPRHATPDAQQHRPLGLKERKRNLDSTRLERPSALEYQCHLPGPRTALSASASNVVDSTLSVSTDEVVYRYRCRSRRIVSRVFHGLVQATVERSQGASPTCCLVRGRREAGRSLSVRLFGIGIGMSVAAKA